MLDIFNSQTPYSYKTGGRIPNGWNYYTDASGIHFTTPNLVTAKGRYVSFWRTRVRCYSVSGQIVNIPTSYQTITSCKTTTETKTTDYKLCLNGSWQIECGGAGGCHGGVAQYYIKASNDFCLTGSESELPSCCGAVGSAGRCGNCTAQDWANWREQRKCLAESDELCIYYDCCNHECDRAIFKAVYYVPQRKLGRDANGAWQISPERREEFLTANLNNSEDGGPRGPFCATIPKPTLANWSETKTYNKTTCVRSTLVTGGGTYQLPDSTQCSDSEFAIVIDVKDKGQVLVPTSVYEGGFDAQPSGMVFYTSFADTLPSPASLGKALLSLNQGATIRRAGWTSTKYIHNNNGFFKLVGGATMPTADDIRAGDWLVFGGESVDATTTTCKTLLTYNEPIIEYDQEVWAQANVSYGDDAQPRVSIESSGHNGRKIDGIRNRYAFNFTHTLPPSTKTRKLYTHILTEKIFNNKLSSLFAEEWQQIDQAENPASKVYFVYGIDGQYHYVEEGMNDVSLGFNRDTPFENDRSNGGSIAGGYVYKHIWHDLSRTKGMKITKPSDLPAHLYMPDQQTPFPDDVEIFIPENARTMPFKREIPLQDVEIVKIYILVPPRGVPTKLICSASSFIDKTGE